MNVIEVNGKKKFRMEVPSNWNELSAKQVLSIAKLWGDVHQSLKLYPAGLNYFRVQVLFILAGLRRNNILNENTRMLRSLLPSRLEVKRYGKTNEFMERYEYLLDLMALTDFVFLEHVSLTKNPLPYLRVGFTKLFGPADGCVSMTLKEFILVDAVFTAWITTRKQEYLDEMVAMLYRPHGGISKLSSEYPGDDRAPFNNLAYDAWKPKVEKLPNHLKVAITLFYQGCRRSWEKLYPQVFSKSEAEGGGETGWFAVMSELPAGKFGTIKEREATNIDTVFSELNRLITNQPKKA